MNHIIITFIVQRGKEKLYISKFFDQKDFSESAIEQEMEAIKIKTRSDFVAVHGLWVIDARCSFSAVNLPEHKTHDFNNQF